MDDTNTEFMDPKYKQQIPLLKLNHHSDPISFSHRDIARYVEEENSLI